MMAALYMAAIDPLSLTHLNLIVIYLKGQWLIDD